MQRQARPTLPRSILDVNRCTLGAAREEPWMKLAERQYWNPMAAYPRRAKVATGVRQPVGKALAAKGKRRTRLEN
eukprot:12885033-Alexandrium_andersonii.AAC.1